MVLKLINRFETILFSIIKQAMQMKLCMIVPYYIPIKGGITTYVSSLVTSLNKYNFNITVIARYGNIDENIYITNQKLYFIIKSFLILCKKRPDVIHAHSHWYILTPSVIYKLIHPKTRLIFTFHTEPIDEPKGLKKIALQWLLLRCNTITFVSKALMKKVEDNLKITTTKKVIYAGVSVKKVSEAEVQQFKERFLLKNINAPIIAFVGPLMWKQKVEGVKILIKSFRIIRGKYPNSKLLIIGDGEYKRELQQLTEKSNIQDNVVFIGFVDNVFVPLSITDIYTHISLQEGFPLSILEAMSMGKPVIATKIGGIPELIIDGKNGIVVDSEPKAIADAILELYSDEEKRVRLSEAAKKTVENCKWSIIAEEFIAIYR